MRNDGLRLFTRQSRPRTRGLTVVIDSGLPTTVFDAVLASFGEYVDLVKFGWGTALVTRDLDRKIGLLAESGTDFHLGGTLFEKYVAQGRFDDYRRLCHELGCRFVEVSAGTIELPAVEKCRYIEKLATEFSVLAEVGYKDEARSAALGSDRWIELIRADLDAGAYRIVLESREGGTGGMCHLDGRLRTGLVEDILAAAVEVDRLIFEAPTKSLQTQFINLVGPEVSLGNIAVTDIAAVETLRLGLRSDTLLQSEEWTA